MRYVPDTQGAAAPSTGRSSFVAIIVILAAGSIGLTYYVFRQAPPPTSSQSAPSIAVLPFADMSPGGDQAWFADGVSEEILNVLAKTEGLQVASRTASFRYRGDDTDIKAAAAEMNVTTVLEGSVRSQGDQMRITAQLINAEDGFHLWSDSFDRQLSDIFTVQDEISAHIATALFGELGIGSATSKSI